MNLLTADNATQLWQCVVKEAERDCSVTLNQSLEAYLTSLLIRYTNQADISKRILATSFLEAVQDKTPHRNQTLQTVGDDCLIYTGLFPHATRRRLVQIDYFVDLGRSAYLAISGQAAELYTALAGEFVMLMDVLQSIRPELLEPYEAYLQWRLCGSQYAKRLLKRYTGVILPFTSF